MSKKKPHQASEGQRVKQEIQRAIIFNNIEELYVVKTKNDHSNEQKKAPSRVRGAKSQTGNTTSNNL
ncbi:hypothetical protein [Colwellia sp. MB3u-4]|uniref:hypothetical protein n=1 Tax=Colwellia sp. MB3u-4 TaxID=2759822 RepID=UPI0015F4E59A|nr:hypothetical protein [Colwellia sp. MB3u-4]MBA6290335.1 hypothetical protein [Colwellia sp. MB3u-4]